jgi:hypothetical protein
MTANSTRRRWTAVQSDTSIAAPTSASTARKATTRIPEPPATMSGLLFTWRSASSRSMRRSSPNGRENSNGPSASRSAPSSSVIQSSSAMAVRASEKVFIQFRSWSRLKMTEGPAPFASVGKRS